PLPCQEILQLTNWYYVAGRLEKQKRENRGNQSGQKYWLPQRRAGWPQWPIVSYFQFLSPASLSPPPCRPFAGWLSGKQSFRNQLCQNPLSAASLCIQFSSLWE